MFKPTHAVLLTGLAIAACGEQERPTKQELSARVTPQVERLTKHELSARVTPQVERVTSDFSEVFEAIGRAEETDPVPAAALEKLRAAAETERRAADELEGLTPPEAAESALDGFVAAAREQAARLEEVAAADPTVGELANAVESPEMGAALARLAEGGYAEVPAPH